MIKEVLVVEGKMDIVAIDKAVEADCIITGGFSLKPKTLDDIEKAYKKYKCKIIFIGSNINGYTNSEHINDIGPYEFLYLFSK